MAPTGRARCRISASSAAAVFWAVAKPVRLPPRGVRNRGKSERPGDISFAIRNTAAAAAWEAASPRASKASATAVVSKLTVEIIAPSSTSTAGLSPAPSRSASTARRAAASCSQSRAVQSARGIETTADPAPAAPGRARTGRCRREAGAASRTLRPGRAPAAAPPRAGRSATGSPGSLRSDSAPAAIIASMARSASWSVSAREPDAVRVGVQKRDRVLRSERRDGDAGKPQRLGAGHPAAAAFGLAGADERQESLRQGARDRPRRGFRCAGRADARRRSACRAASLRSRGKPRRRRGRGRRAGRTAWRGPRRAPAARRRRRPGPPRRAAGSSPSRRSAAAYRRRRRGPVVRP